MITWQTLRKSIDNKQFGKGICTSDDEKPVEDIANGSELIEIDTGKRCVFDLGREEWIEYGTGETRTQKPGNVRTEVYEGTLSELFDISKMKTYWDALQAGAIGIITAKLLGETSVSFPVNIIPFSIDEEPVHIFAAGVGFFGDGFRNLQEAVEMEEYPRTFSTRAEFENYIESGFASELGLSIVASIRGLETDNPEFAFPFAYVNTGNIPTLLSIKNLDRFGSFTLTFYYMDEGVEPSGGAKVTTETISGPLSTIFSDNEWNEAKFRQLEEDIRAGQASARLTVAAGSNYFDAQLMVAGSASSAETMVLATAFFTFTLNGFVVRIVWSFEGETGIEGVMMAYSPSTKAWDTIDDSALSQMTGQSSYDLVITRIEEE